MCIHRCEILLDTTARGTLSEGVQSVVDGGGPGEAAHNLTTKIMTKWCPIVATDRAGRDKETKDCGLWRRKIPGDTRTKVGDNKCTCEATAATTTTTHPTNNVKGSNIVFVFSTAVSVARHTSRTQQYELKVVRKVWSIYSGFKSSHERKFYLPGLA